MRPPIDERERAIRLGNVARILIELARREKPAIHANELSHRCETNPKEDKRKS
jgi:hypothetical protein